ncbi:TPA: hypothetical protein ACGTP8_001200 [Yersinia enterocolitica]|uniref:hypothetical protein n=1 Tax=Yersinia massiliensis TaxID=419257 RepID=UPI0028D317B3|nr:hypothetical protein [Yersinia massiliensis]
MHWVLLSGDSGDFMNAIGAIVLLIVSQGMRKFQDDGGNEYVLSDRFEGDYRLLAERRLVPIKANKRISG